MQQIGPEIAHEIARVISPLHQLIHILENVHELHFQKVSNFGKYITARAAANRMLNRMQNRRYV
jgi:hypothetical protein